jgi:hypothetical protein
MNIQLEPLRDLSLEAETAESVIGGRGTRTSRSLHHTRPLSRLFQPAAPLVETTSSEGLGMGPDPGYPNSDTGDGGC